MLTKPTCEDVVALVAQMRATGAELADVEAKDGRRGLPQRIHESLSAMANRRGGGVIVFGVEDGTFRPVGGIDVGALQSDLSSLIDQRLSYPIRVEFLPCTIEGQQILAARVPECPAQHKPIWYKGKGIIGGSWLRVGNSNHLLSEAEVRAILRAGDRDDTDAEPVRSATSESFSMERLASYREVIAARSPASERLTMSNEELLLAVGAAVAVGDVIVPTVAGLLFFCDNPQRYLPGAFLSVVQFGGTQIAQSVDGAPIYLDNVRIDGPLPDAIERARLAVLVRIRKRALLDGFTRREIPEYPDWAYREALVNAIAHRDYALSGSHVQLRLFADRIEIQSPGGLFGTVSEASIEHEQSTRNHRVVRLLEDFGLVEQRGVGIDRMIREMLAAGLDRPVFRDSLTSFTVTLKNHTMMDGDAYRWLSGFAGFPLSDPQRVALVYAWRTGKVVNRDYQRLNSVSSVVATKDLKGLVGSGLLRQHGTKGVAYYTLSELVMQPARRNRLADEERVIEYVRQHGRITNAIGRDLLGIPDVWTMRLILRRLVRRGALIQEGSAKQLTYYTLGGKP